MKIYFYRLSQRNHILAGSSPYGSTFMYKVSEKVFSKIPAQRIDWCYCINLQNEREKGSVKDSRDWKRFRKQKKKRKEKIERDRWET